jgi:hypothetical protein
MSKLSKAGIGFHGLVDSLSTLLQEWHPPVLKTETDYSKALAEYLRLALPEDAQVEREYRHEGTTCDVCVRYKGLLGGTSLVLCEVKRNLQKKSDYDRLVGQVEGLRPKKNNVIVVLVGDTDRALLGRLRDQFKQYVDGTLGEGETFRIVVVA